MTGFWLCVATVVILGAVCFGALLVQEPPEGSVEDYIKAKKGEYQ